ncbi:hypothetical protein Taro_054849 [Colocasia esculenta]|uniref:Leucine-rich repeat-containing N-terminal plant-type domain-containing protein n=1 Tax=Colocasia esculenta TaxID=4460 RepID=A0A843XRL1_COLES|nr:hypothetical protein [Colocasia esculenta]
MSAWHPRHASMENFPAKAAVVDMVERRRCSSKLCTLFSDVDICSISLRSCPPTRQRSHPLTFLKSLALPLPSSSPPPPIFGLFIMDEHPKASWPFNSRPHDYCNIRQPLSRRNKGQLLSIPCQGLRLLFLLSWAFSGGQLGVSAQCPAEQRDALLHLKQGFTVSALRGNSTSDPLHSWRPGTDCCRGWVGVSCDATSGRVGTLDLSHFHIKGKVDQALFSLTSLRILDLSCNQLDPEAFPSQGFEMLSNLTRLNLSDSGFGGLIPAGISRLRSLVSLDLSAYGICSTSSLRLKSPDLKALVGNLTNLQELYLRGVNISAGGHEWGPALSSSLPSLRELDLAGCSLSGPIDSSLSKLTNLTILRLNQNNLSSELPEFLGNLSYLSYLRLSYCGLRGPIPGGIFKLPRLQNLDVSKNPILSGHLPDFPDDRILENLWLFETNMSGSLPDSIGNLKFLKTLRLSNCIFSGSLPASFANLTQLVFVDLSANNFSGRIPSFASSTNLMELNLQNNSLTGPVPGWLFSLPALRTLQLNLNQLSGELGEFSDEASLLQTVDLSSNKLHGSFPKSVAKLSGIQILKFASNRLNGTVGLDLFANLNHLSIFDLSNNLLTVEATSSMSFPRVSTLNLASCNLVGFPEFLRNQSILSRLDLSNNLIDGVVPNWLWSVGNGGLAYLNLSHNSLKNFESPPDLSRSALIVLDINSNKLRGQIPLPPPQNLFVDYSNNQFTSTFPSDIVWNLSFTMFFSAANNTLVGEIPSYFCSSTYLQVLDLSVNNFTGQIPKCLLASVNDLRVLNLRDNKLSGSLPGESAERCKLRTLNVNGNMLVGAVPQSLSNCKLLQVLDLGNNQIEDSFPSWLGNLTDLRVLVLRSNRFHGHIPIPNGDNYTSFSMLQILDISSNRFSGPLPAACLKSCKAMTATDEQSGSLVGKFGRAGGGDLALGVLERREEMVLQACG